MNKILQTLFTYSNILIFSFFISFLYTYIKVKNYDKKIKKRIICILLIYVHSLPSMIISLFVLKLFLLPILLYEYILIVIILAFILLFAFLFEGCILTILENKCLGLPEDIKEKDKSKICLPKRFIKIHKITLIILILLSVKYLIESYII